MTKPSGPGDLLGHRYELCEVLGRGGQATTLRAWDRQGQAWVAIKRLDLDRVDDWKAVELFEREAEALRDLHHPNIPRYIDAFHTGGQGPRPATAPPVASGAPPERLDVGEGEDATAPSRPALDDPDQDPVRRFYLVRELVEGESLGERLRRGQRLDPASATALLDSLLATLAALHAHDPPLIHRDVKPDNIILRPDGGASLIDLGTIKVLRARASRALATTTVVGTPGYMAPEAFRAQASPASDLYSLGVTVLCAVSGLAPQDLPTRGLTPDVRRAAPALPSRLAGPLSQLVQADPRRRLQTAATARRALALGVPPPPRGWRRAAPWVVGGGLVLVVTGSILMRGLVEALPELLAGGLVAVGVAWGLERLGGRRP